MIYEHIVVGAGISGCSVASELSVHSSNLLLVDKGSGVASGASGAAGAFLSPLLGKPNEFKDLVTDSLKYSTTIFSYLGLYPNRVKLNLRFDANAAFEINTYATYSLLSAVAGGGLSAEQLEFLKMI